MSENNKNNEENQNQKNSDKINEFDKLVIDIRNNLTTRLDDLMSKLLNSAQEELFNLSREATSNEEQTRVFDLMKQSRTLKPDITIDFSSGIKKYLVPSKDYEDQHSKKEVEEDDELSLVGQDEMEGIVLVKGIGERATAKYRDQLSHLEARLEHLATKTSHIFKEDALSPTNFCQAFDDAMAENFSNENKKLMFAMFDVAIANKLDALYDSINNRLIDAGILPQIKLHMQRQQAAKPRPKPTAANPEPDKEQGQEQVGQDDYAEGDGGAQAGNHGGGQAGGAPAGAAPGGQTGGYGGGRTQADGGQNATANPEPSGGSNIGGFAMTAAPGGAYQHTPQQAQSGAGDGAPGNDQGAAQGKTQGSFQNSSNNTGEYQHYTAGLPANQVGQVIGNYLGGSALTPSTADQSTSSGGEFFPASTPQHFGHQEIIQALSSLQNLPQFEQTEDLHFDGEAIKQAVLAEIAKKSGGGVTKRINTIAEKTIDFIELIFDAIIDDNDISDTIKTLLLRLQIPIIKASMADQKFFIYDDHPARTLLDTIADVGVGITNHDDEMYKHLDKIISNILSEYDLTTDIFRNALDNLNAIVEKEEKLSRAKEEEEQRQLLRKHARATVLKALRATTTSKALPELVHPLILKRWPTLMFNHYIKKGKENDEWVNLVLTLRHIVDSVQPISSAKNLAKLIAEKDSLFEQTEKYLNIASQSKKDVQNIMSMYQETIQSHIDDANFTEQEVNVAEEILSHADPVEEAPIEEPDTQDKTALPSSVMPGMWFQI